MAAVKKVDYAALQVELEQIMTQLQRDDGEIDAALKHYARGLEIAKLLEDYLKTAENTVRELKASFSAT